MMLECSHCGQRAPEGTERCPNCLRATGWIEVAELPKGPTRKKLISIAAGVVAIGTVVGGGVLAFTKYKQQQRASVQAGTSTEQGGQGEQEVPAPFESGAAVRALAAQCNAPTPLAKARQALDAIRSKITATSHGITESVYTVPAVRTTDAIAQAVQGPRSAFSSLDLARLLAAVLREAQVPFTFARRTTGTRPNIAPDPTGLMGRYVVIVENIALDPTDGQAIARSEARPVALEVGAVTGAMLVQAALAAEHTDQHPRALVLIRRAVDQWGDGGIPHATRAFLTRSSGGDPQEVMRDLDTAVVATNDDPGIHLFRAHTAVAFGDPTLARTSAQLAFNRARGWGDAALAAALTYTPAPASDAGIVDRGRCERFLDARETWTDDALTACPALSSDAPATETQMAAAQRVGSGANDPMRVAFAMAVRRSSAGFTVNSANRREIVGWLLLAGAPQVAQELMRDPDGGQ